MREDPRHHHRSIPFSILRLITLREAPARTLVPPRHLTDPGREPKLIVQGRFLFLNDITHPGCRDPTMCGAGYWNNIGPRSREAADICGIQALYL